MLLLQFMQDFGHCAARQDIVARHEPTIVPSRRLDCQGQVGIHSPSDIAAAVPEAGESLFHLLDDLGSIIRRGAINDDDFDPPRRLSDDAVECRPDEAPKSWVGMQIDSRTLLTLTHRFAGEASGRDTLLSLREPVGAGSTYMQGTAPA